jgi:hypothetical protein
MTVRCGEYEIFIQVFQELSIASNTTARAVAAVFFPVATAHRSIARSAAAGKNFTHPFSNSPRMRNAPSASGVISGEQFSAPVLSII